MLANELLGERIRNRRVSMKISQGDLGKAIGRSHATISDIERGKREITVNDLLMIADYLNTPVTNFFDFDNQYSLSIQHKGIVINNGEVLEANTEDINHPLQISP